MPKSQRTKASRAPRKKSRKDWNEFPLVYRPGHPLADSQNMVPRRLVHLASADAAFVISDDLGSMLEHHGYDDGRKTESKSVFRAWTKAKGLVEKGNDRERPSRPDPVAQAREMQRDVAKSIEMLNQGYRPRIQTMPGAVRSDGWQ